MALYYSQPTMMSPTQSVPFSWANSPRSTRPLNILCLDGGGYRGLASLLVLRHLLILMHPNKNPSELYPHEFFDLICGTSTGGLIALLLVKMKMDIESVIRAYNDLAPKIFGSDKGVAGVISRGERFESAKLEKAIKEIVGDKMMYEIGAADDGCACFITTRDSGTTAGGRPVHLIRTYSNEGAHVPPAGYNWSVLEAALGTSAAPTYFSPLTVNHANFSFQFEDAGAAGANNPSFLAWKEITSHPRFKGREINCFLSLGTGKPGLLTHSAPVQEHDWKSLNLNVNPLSRSKHRLQQFLENLVDQATDSTATHDVVSSTFETHPHLSLDMYYRLNPDGLGDINLAAYFLGAEIYHLTSSFLSSPTNQRTMQACVARLRGGDPGPNPGVYYGATPANSLGPVGPVGAYGPSPLALPGLITSGPYPSPASPVVGSPVYPNNIQAYQEPSRRRDAVLASAKAAVCSASGRLIPEPLHFLRPSRSCKDMRERIQ